MFLGRYMHVAAFDVKTYFVIVCRCLKVTSNFERWSAVYCSQVEVWRTCVVEIGRFDPLVSVC